MSKPNIALLVRNQPAPYIASMNRHAELLTQSGRSIIKLSGGDPQHVPLAMRDILHELVTATDAERMFSYSPINGFRDLRARVARFVTRRYGRDVTEDQLLVCSGGCPGLFLALKTMVNPGDCVLIPDPCWEYLPCLVEHCGARLERIKAFRPSNGAPNWDKLLEEVSLSLRLHGTRALVINSPLNPTGAVIPIEVMVQLAELCGKYGAWLLSDEVTIDFKYADQPMSMQSNAQLDGFNNLISVQSFSKNFGLTGFRFGYVIGPPTFIEQVGKAQLYTFMYPSSFVQEAVSRYLALGDAEVLHFIDHTVSLFHSRARTFVSMLSDTPGLEAQMPEGGLFLFPRVPNGSSIDWVQALEKFGVAVSPGAAFGSQCADHIRLFVGVDEGTMKQAADFLRKVMSEM